MEDEHVKHGSTLLAVTETQTTMRRPYTLLETTKKMTPPPHISKAVEKPRQSPTARGSVPWCSHSEKQSGSFRMHTFPHIPDLWLSGLLAPHLCLPAVEWAGSAASWERVNVNLDYALCQWVQQNLPSLTDNQSISCTNADPVNYTGNPTTCEEAIPEHWERGAQSRGRWATWHRLRKGRRTVVWTIFKNNLWPGERRRP